MYSVSRKKAVQYTGIRNRVLNYAYIEDAVEWPMCPDVYKHNGEKLKYNKFPNNMCTV